MHITESRYATKESMNVSVTTLKVTRSPPYLPANRHGNHELTVKTPLGFRYVYQLDTATK